MLKTEDVTIDNEVTGFLGVISQERKAVLHETNPKSIYCPLVPLPATDVISDIAANIAK